MQKESINYVLHVEYSMPFVKNFFGVYSTAEQVVDAIIVLKPKHVPTSAEIKATFVASDVYTQAEEGLRLWVGEVPEQMVEYACGKLQRIRSELLLPGRT
jgi:hypothetical protein